MDTELKKKLAIDIIVLVSDLEDFDKGIKPLGLDALTAKHALLSAKIARLNFFVSQQAERSSNRLLLLTWALLALTFFLFILTAYLTYDSYTDNHYRDLPKQGSTQQPKPD